MVGLEGRCGKRWPKPAARFAAQNERRTLLFCNVEKGMRTRTLLKAEQQEPARPSNRAGRPGVDVMPTVPRVSACGIMRKLEMGGYPELFHPPYQHGAAACHRAGWSALTAVQSYCHTTVDVRSGRGDGMCQQMKRKHRALISTLLFQNFRHLSFRLEGLCNRIVPLVEKSTNLRTFSYRNIDRPIYLARVCGIRMEPRTHETDSPLRTRHLLSTLTGSGRTCGAYGC